MGSISPLNTETVPEFIRERYNEEREKRRHPKSSDQYILDLRASDKYKQFQDDVWETKESAKTEDASLKDSDSCKFLIIGAGYGGLLYAVNLIKAGIDVKHIRLVDIAKGFGGSWYWNRYPGLQCDVESYIYMPLLEETGYMPKYKYCYGPELREHAERIADQFRLNDRTLFGTRADSMSWDENTSQWNVKLEQRSAVGEISYINVRANFIFTAFGIGNFPKLPNIEGLDKFEGHSFHTSRWNYNVTGGTPSDPTLHKLHDKRVGIVGTGSTSIQAIPHLAKHAKSLYVFQRTPSSVGIRKNVATDPERWETEIARKKGWQMERAENWNAFLMNQDPKPEVNMVADEWTKLPSYSGLVGGPLAVNVTKENVAKYVEYLNVLDLPSQEATRAVVDKYVDDPATAEKLKAWYPSWCKRPCFNDEYYSAFNSPNVMLVETNGRGVEKVGPRGVILDGTEYDLDILIFATGFRPPAHGSPAARCRMSVYGRNGLCMEEKWDKGLSTLHGVISKDFPNFFFPGPFQTGAIPNASYRLDILAKQAAYIITTASIKIGEGREIASGTEYNFEVEPTAQAEDDWGERVAETALAFSAMSECTPNHYVTPISTVDPAEKAEETKQKSRGALWGKGMVDYLSVLQRWQDEGNLQGLVVTRK